MAYICEKPKGSCKKCAHFRYDEDYGGMACFAQVDLEAVSALAKELTIEPANGRLRLSDKLTGQRVSCSNRPTTTKK